MKGTMGSTMQTTVSKWGNSLALRLPRHIAEEVKLFEGSTVCVEIEDGSLRVTPTRKRSKLSELLEGEPSKAAEFDWGKPLGDEAW
jgi:antitoxin MazE